MRKLIRRYLRGRLGSEEDLEHVWRGQVFAIACLVVMAALAIIATNQWTQGLRLVSVAIAAVTVTVFLLPLVANDARSLRRACHAMVALGFATLVLLSVLRGGLSSPVPMGFAVIPAVAGILIGGRAMIVWALIVVLYLLGLGLVPPWLGFDLVDRFPPGGQVFSLFLSPILLVLTFTGLIRMMLRLQGKALEVARTAERERLTAEHSVAQQRTEQMAMVGQLAVGVAHEVNNPLSYVVANVEYAAERLRESDHHEWKEAIDALNDAGDGARRIGRIVTQLSAHGRAEEERVEPVRLRECVETAIRIANNQLRHRARVNPQFRESPIVDADSNRLTQVFLNILINAAHAIPVGDRDANEVSITVGLDDRGKALVEIADTGEGIDPEILPRITEPFFTTKEVGAGTGLGLSISHAIVDAYRGKLEISSEIGVGTRVSVRLPLSQGQLRSTHDELFVRAASPDLGRVLIIDDDEPVRLSLARSLPAQVVTAGRVVEALELIERGEDFDAIICDVMMPDLTGLDFYDRIEQEWPHLLPRVVFLTGGVFDAETRAFLRARDVTVLTKPLLRRELIEAIELVSPQA